MSAYAMFCRGNPTGGSFGSSYPCYARKSLGSLSDELWLTSRVAFPDSVSPYKVTTAPPGTNGESGYMQAFFNTGSYFNEVLDTLEGISYNVPASRWEEIAQGFDLHASSPLPLEFQKWYTLESHYEAGAARGSTIHCDGTWSASAPAQEITDIAVGCFFARNGFFLQGFYDIFEVVVDHVMVGTTRHGNDVFEDDFASGDFSAWTAREFGGWTGTEGDPSVGFGCTIIDRPAYPFLNETCNPFGERLGVHLAPVTIPYGNVPIGAR